MNKIFKYQLESEDTQTLDIKGLVKPLSVGLDSRGELCVWCLVDSMKERSFKLEVYSVLTEADMPEGLSTDRGYFSYFLGTVMRGQVMNQFEVHVFALKEPI